MIFIYQSEKVQWQNKWMTEFLLFQMDLTEVK